jgi:sugar phosphate isomerase/epimerase
MTLRGDRRHFLRSAASLSAGSLLAALPGGLAGPAAAIEPIERPGPARFKFSLAAYSYRDLLSGPQPELTLDDFVADCAAMQLDGTELTSYYFPAETNDEYLRRLKGLCFRLGLDISGTAVGNDFCQPPGDERDRQIALVKTWIDRAEILGAPVIRIFSGAAHDGQDEAQARKLAIDGMQACCDYAGQHGVFLALENHGGLTTDVAGMLSLVRDINSPWFGVNVDTGNFHSADIYGDLAQLAPYALNVQVKVVVQPAGGDRQPSDFGRLARILRDASYRGYIVLEYEEDEDPREACPRYLDELRQAFA